MRRAGSWCATSTTLYRDHAGAACPRLRGRGLRVAGGGRYRRTPSSPGCARRPERTRSRSSQLHPGGASAATACRCRRGPLARDRQHRRGAVWRLRQRQSRRWSSPRTVPARPAIARHVHRLPPLATSFCLECQETGVVTCWKPTTRRGRTPWRRCTVRPLARDAMAYVLAGGRGSRLKELTDQRAKPAVYFGGKTRIIDFALSNALNSGIRRIGGGDAVQGAQPDPPPAARLELPAPRAQRELRHPAGQPARVRDPVVRGHRRRGLSEHRHHRELRARSTWSSWPATTSTRWTTR